MTSLWIRMGELREIEAARLRAEALGVEPFRTVAEIEPARADDDPEATARMIRPGDALPSKKTPDS
jgi:hypothetical protein